MQPNQLEEDQGLSSGPETTPRLRNQYIPELLKRSNASTQTMPSIRPQFTNPTSVTKTCRIARNWIFLSDLLQTKKLTEESQAILKNDLENLPYSIVISHIYDDLVTGYAEYFDTWKELTIKTILCHLKLIVSTKQELLDANIDENDADTLWSMICKFIPDSTPSYPSAPATAERY